MAVQVFPFIYTALFIFLFTAYSFLDGVWLDIVCRLGCEHCQGGKPI